MGSYEIYTSTLPRAWQTAEYVARALQLPVQPDDDLHEVRPGEADGMTVDEWRTRYLPPGQSAVHDPFQAVSPGGESWAAFLARAGAALAALVDRHPDQTVVAVCHAASSRRRFTWRSGSAAPATGSRSPRSTPASRGGGTGAGQMGAVSGRSSPSTTLATSPAPRRRPRHPGTPCRPRPARADDRPASFQAGSRNGAGPAPLPAGTASQPATSQPEKVLRPNRLLHPGAHRLHQPSV